jgi:hypothetical protein
VLTRVSLETSTVSRVRFGLAAAGLSTARDGTNDDLNESFAKALGYFGATAADRSRVQDADLAAVPATLEEQFLDWVEIDALELCRTALLFAPQRVEWEDYQEDREQALAYLVETLTQKRAEYASRYDREAAPRVGAIEDTVKHPFRTDQWFAGRRRGRDGLPNPYGYDL